LLKENVPVDRVIIFSDMQLWNSYGSGATLQTKWNDYRKKHPNCWLHLVDLAGHGTSPAVMQGNVHLVSGWSDSILSFIKTVEEGEGSMIDAISRSSLNDEPGIRVHGGSGVTRKMPRTTKKKVVIRKTTKKPVKKTVVKKTVKKK
jgi:hypothetical protein